MKKFFLLLCLVAFISCKPRNTQKTEQIDTSQEEIQQSEVKEEDHLLNYFIDNFTGEFAKENEPQKTVIVIEQICDDIFHINLTWKNFSGEDKNFGGDFSFSTIQNKNKVYEYSAEGGFTQVYFKVYLEDEKLKYKVACYKAYLDDDMNITEEYREDEVYTLIKIK